MYEAASEHKKSTVEAISSGLPIRPIGTIVANCLTCHCVALARAIVRLML